MGVEVETGGVGGVERVSNLSPPHPLQTIPVQAVSTVRNNQSLPRASPPASPGMDS